MTPGLGSCTLIHMSTNTPVTFLGISDEFDTCECCGKSNLRRTVALRFDDDMDPVFYGTSCAARTLGMTNTAVTNAAAVAQHRANIAAELADELRAVYAAALVAFRAGDDGDANLCRARRTYNNVGADLNGPRGTDRWGVNFPTWIGIVADTGTIPETVAA